jgi:hypothetical protein
MHSTRHAFGLRAVEPPKTRRDDGDRLKGHGRPYQLALSSDDNWLYIVKNIVKTRTFKRHRSVTAASSTSSEPRSTELLQKSVRLL